jgi:hypothetical protein
MNTELITDQCYQCQSHFIKEEMLKITLESSPIVLYVCSSCSSNTTNKGIIDTAVENLKLFI